jgi:hypothetical protein
MVRTNPKALWLLYARSDGFGADCVEGVGMLPVSSTAARQT